MRTGAHLVPELVERGVDSQDPPTWGKGEGNQGSLGGVSSPAYVRGCVLFCHV